MRVEPEIAQFDAAMPPGPRMTSDPVLRRANALEHDRRVFDLLGTPGPAVATDEHSIPVEGHPAVRVRIYYPGAQRPSAPVPGFIAFFGGGFVQGGIDYPSYDATYRRRAHDSGVAMVAVDYALSPEHRFPTPVEQGYAVLDRVHARGLELGIDPDRLGIGGVSSGGNIAAATTLLNRERANHRLRLQILEVPSTDLTLGSIDNAAARALTRLPGVLAKQLLKILVVSYLGDDRRRLSRNGLASPLLAASHASLPPAHIFTAELDPLRGDGERYAEALWRAGVPATSVRYAGQTHGSSGLVGISPGATRWHRDVVACLRTLLE